MRMSPRCGSTTTIALLAAPFTVALAMSLFVGACGDDDPGPSGAGGAGPSVSSGGGSVSSSGGEMPAGTERGSAVVGAIGNEIVVVGGLRGGQAVADASAYDTTTNSWRALPALPEVRDHAVGGVVDDTLYVSGGRATSIGSISSDVYAFRLADGAWCRRAPLPTARGGAAAAVVGSEIVVMGGEGNPDDPSGTFREVEVYDAPSNRWRIDNPLPAGRHGTGAASVGGTIVVPGGAEVQAFGAIGTVLRPSAD
jgi:N-acetylneuraminic acid mutarotase